MSRRLIFGGPSELHPDEYRTHPRLVERGYGEHAGYNPDYDSYGGLGAGVTYGQEMPKEAQRGLVYNANQDMKDDLRHDGVPKKKWPGAMGSYWAQGAVARDGSNEQKDDEGEYGYEDDNIRRGHQIYLGSSIKQKRNGDYKVVLEPSLREQLAKAANEKEPPTHRRNYQCAEPGLISDHRYANGWDDFHGHDRSEEEGGGRFYVEDKKDRYLPPCGHDPEYGCSNICEVTGDKDIGYEYYEY